MYNDMLLQLKGLTEDVPYMTANLANISALIYNTLDRINWAGFYLMQDGKLVVGPFQGKPACVSIKIGRGVCGTAAERDETLVVEDVHDFPGHIACDAASRSEIVIPIHDSSRIIGVLDIDSPEKGRFNEADKEGLTSLVKVIEERINGWK